MVDTITITINAPKFRVGQRVIVSKINTQEKYTGYHGVIAWIDSDIGETINLTIDLRENDYHKSIKVEYEYCIETIHTGEFLGYAYENEIELDEDDGA